MSRVAELGVARKLRIQYPRAINHVMNFVRIARARVAVEAKTLPRPGRPLQITLDPDSKDAFVEVLMGDGMWQTNWAVTINRDLKVTHCTLAMGREGPEPRPIPTVDSGFASFLSSDHFRG